MAYIRHQVLVSRGPGVMVCDTLMCSKSNGLLHPIDRDDCNALRDGEEKPSLRSPSSIGLAPDVDHDLKNGWFDRNSVGKRKRSPQPGVRPGIKSPHLCSC